MLLECLLEIVVKVDNIPFSVKTPVEGILISKNNEGRYLVDFSKGVLKFDNLVGNSKDYKEVIVDSNKCFIKNKE